MMRQGLLKGAPGSLKSACECLEPDDAPALCEVDKKKLAAAGLSQDDLKSCALFLVSASTKEEAAIDRMLTKLFGPRWESRFPVKSADDQSVAKLFASRAALAMLKASGKKLGVIGTLG